MRISTLPLVIGAAITAAFAFAHPSSAAANGCNVGVGRNYPGAPPAFALPNGGRESDFATTFGGRECDLLRPDGTLYARATEDAYSQLESLEFYGPGGERLLTLNATHIDPSEYGGSGGGSTRVHCGVDAENRGVWRWVSTINWYVTNTPGYLNQTNTITSLRTAHAEWVDNLNWCGYSDNSSFNTAYQGTTTSSFGQNGKNTFGWGDAGAICGGSGTTVACTECWGDPFYGFATECDTRMDNVYFSWSNGSGAANTMDVQGVAAHEMGHQAQFDHVTDNSNVMYPYVYFGDISPEELGRGDALEDNSQY